MEDLTNMLDVFARNAEKQLVPDHKTREAMTMAGAEVLADALRKTSHVSSKKNPKYGHLKDNIRAESGDLDGNATGDAVVGFHEKGYVARFLNDGTVKMRGDHWVDNTRREKADEVFKAEKKVYDAMKGGN